MTHIDARREVQDAWEAVPLDYRRVARATAMLLELCDYNLVSYADQFTAHEEWFGDERWPRIKR